MIQTTVNELLHGKVDHVVLEGIYIFRDGQYVLYVGRSNDVIKRLHDHIEGWASSSIGSLLRENRPASFNWQIELMSVDECMPVVRSFYTRYSDDETRIADIKTAEQSMIRHYHPCMNTSNNPNGRGLPSHIKLYAEPLEVGLTDHLY